MLLLYKAFVEHRNIVCGEFCRSLRRLPRPECSIVAGHCGHRTIPLCIDSMFGMFNEVSGDLVSCTDAQPEETYREQYREPGRNHFEVMSLSMVTLRVETRRDGL